MHFELFVSEGIYFNNGVREVCVSFKQSVLYLLRSVKYSDK